MCGKAHPPPSPSPHKPPLCTGAFPLDAPLLSAPPPPLPNPRLVAARPRARLFVFLSAASCSSLHAFADVDADATCQSYMKVIT